MTAFFSVIPDIFNRESRVFAFSSVGEETTLDPRVRKDDRGGASRMTE